MVEEWDICDFAKQMSYVVAIQWNKERHSMTIADLCIALTPSEYRLLFPLRHGLPVTYEQLAHDAYHCALDDKIRMMMDKHIDRIRGKMRGSGLYVYCVLGYGYVLLSTTQQSSALSREL